MWLLAMPFVVVPFNRLVYVYTGAFGVEDTAANLVAFVASWGFCGLWLGVAVVHSAFKDGGEA